MSENEDLKNALSQTLEGINLLIQRENHAANVTKIAADAAKKYEELEGKIKEAESKLNALNIEKDALMAKANSQANEILATALETQKLAESKLEEAKKVEQKAHESLVEAQNTLSLHQAALDDVAAQKEKLRAALAG